MNKQVEELSKRLSYAMGLRNVKAVELAKKTGIPKSSISQYLSGYTEPKSDRIYLISKALNVQEAWLIGYDVQMERSDDIDDKIRKILHDMTHKQKEKAYEILKIICKEE